MKHGLMLLVVIAPSAWAAGNHQTHGYLGVSYDQSRGRGYNVHDGSLALGAEFAASPYLGAILEGAMSVGILLDDNASAPEPATSNPAIASRQREEWAQANSDAYTGVPLRFALLAEFTPWPQLPWIRPHLLTGYSGQWVDYRKCGQYSCWHVRPFVNGLAGGLALDLLPGRDMAALRLTLMHAQGSDSESANSVSLNLLF